MKEKTAEAYGSWKSPITTELMVSSSIGLSEARIFNSTLYWLESRPQEQGRAAIVRLVNGKPEDILPTPYNCRTTVHEYGGSCYLPTEEGTFFVNFADQQIWRVTKDAGVQQLTRKDGYRFADLAFCTRGKRLVAIAEEHGSSFDEPVNSLASIDIVTGDVVTLHGGEKSGEDFYASPSFSPDGGALTWLTWNHPDMPWDLSLIHI